MKLYDLEKEISEFKFHYNGYENVNIEFIHSKLKHVGQRIEDFLEASKDKDNFELSPGEKLIILSNFWLINAEYFKYNPPHIENAYNKNKILLLDEADAHMHPSLIRDFMNILKNGYIHYLGFQVFMTTHNPITVTFTPKENLFEMKYENDRYSIEKVNFRRHGLKALTDDLVPNFNYKPIKIVYVEGMDDLKFYNFIYNRSFEDNLLDEDVDELQLKFMCTTDGKKDLESKACKEAVKIQVKKYIEYEEKYKINDVEDEIVKCESLSNLIYGIVDRDEDANEPQINIEVLKRYSIENYVFDFIYLFFYLKNKQNDKFKAMLNYYENNNSDFKSENKLKELLEKSDSDINQNCKNLQDIIDTFTSLCKTDPASNHLNANAEPDKKCQVRNEHQIEYVEVKYISSLTKQIIVLKYPKLYLDMRKDGIKNIFQTVFRESYLKRNNTEYKLGKSLFKEFEIAKMISFLEEKKECLIISKDIIDIFDYISFYKNQAFTALENLLEDNSGYEFSKEIIKSIKEIYYYDKLKLLACSKNISFKFQDIEEILNALIEMGISEEKLKKLITELNNKKFESKKPPKANKTTDEINQEIQKCIDKNSFSCPETFMKKVMKICEKEMKNYEKPLETFKLSKKLNPQEITELFEKKLDIQDKYSGDFNEKDQVFRDYLSELIKEYHEYIFKRVDFKQKCLEKLVQIYDLINELN
jgi:hypothetical protein